MYPNKSIFLYIFIFISSLSILSQPIKRVELIRANTLEGTTFLNEPIKKLIGNVVFRHQGVMMYCDSSYQFDNRNDLESFGHIKIIKSDSQSIKGEHLNYFGDTRKAQIRGPNVILNKGTLFLYTTILDYNLETDIGNYYENGRVVDKENVLTSRIGTFYKQKDLFVFVQNVVFTDKKYTIYTDTLEYNTESKVVNFRGPTRIIGPEGTMNALKGEYNSKTKQTNFSGRAVINYQEFTLTADKIYYDQLGKKGIATGNVVVLSKKDSVTIYGDIGHYWGKEGKTKVFPNGLMRSISGKDTLYLSADTLLAINDTVKKIKRMFGLKHVKVYYKSMQAVCDSLVSDIIDSTTTFYKDPVSWNSKNQMRGDTIKIFMKHKKVNKVVYGNKAFMISQDTIGNYNQAKCKRMIATFENNKIKVVDLKTNAESVYYGLEGDTLVSGINHATATDMQVRFSKQKVKKIAYYKKPKAEFIPFHEIKPEDERLIGFKLREKERPTLEIVLGKHKNQVK